MCSKHIFPVTAEISLASSLRFAKYIITTIENGIIKIIPRNRPSGVLNCLLGGWLRFAGRVVTGCSIFVKCAKNWPNPRLLGHGVRPRTRAVRDTRPVYCQPQTLLHRRGRL